MNPTKTNHSQLSRCRGALYGLYIGDALAMPVHWYYDREALKRDYGFVQDYLAPRSPRHAGTLRRRHQSPELKGVMRVGPRQGRESLCKSIVYRGPTCIRKIERLFSGARAGAKNRASSGAYRGPTCIFFYGQAPVPCQQW